MATKNTIAFQFPGQGSQKVGMLAELAQAFPVVESTFAEASEVLGYDLWGKVQGGPAEDLSLTEITQPALLTASIATWRVWTESSDIEPAYVAGHSLGEWSALVAAGVLEFSEAVRLVRLRGKFMQEALPAGKGSMAAVIGLDDERVEEACSTAEGDNPGQVATAVNYNSPGQLVIAGHKEAIKSAIEYCKSFGAKRALTLPVSAPFHTSLMEPAARDLSKEMKGTRFSAPSIPVIHNVTVESESDPEKIRDLMLEQIYSPVPWVSCVQNLVSKGVGTLVECGPGKVLSGLGKRINKSLNMLNLESPDSISSVLEKLK